MPAPSNCGGPGRAAGVEGEELTLGALVLFLEGARQYQPKRTGELFLAQKVTREPRPRPGRKARS